MAEPGDPDPRSAGRRYDETGWGGDPAYRAAWEDLGYSSTRQTQLKAMRAAELATARAADPVALLADEFRRAPELTPAELATNGAG